MHKMVGRIPNADIFRAATFSRCSGRRVLYATPRPIGKPLLMIATRSGTSLKRAKLMLLSNGKTTADYRDRMHRKRTPKNENERTSNQPPSIGIDNYCAFELNQEGVLENPTGTRFLKAF